MLELDRRYANLDLGLADLSIADLARKLGDAPHPHALGKLIRIEGALERETIARAERRLAVALPAAYAAHRPPTQLGQSWQGLQRACVSLALAISLRYRG